MTLRTLNYGNYGIFLIMGNAGFCPSTVSLLLRQEDTEGFEVLRFGIYIWFRVFCLLLR